MSQSTLSAALRRIDDDPDFADWSRHNCHAASLGCIRTGLLPEGARVARGRAEGVGGQHSWIVLGDPYRPETIIDPSIWSYRGHEPRIVVSKSSEGYRPHGAGFFMHGARPPTPLHTPIDLDVEWSEEAQFFFETLGHDLDYQGWAAVAHLPVEGWPAKEIITAMYRDPRLRALVPIDIVGMVTDENPDNLYW